MLTFVKLNLGCYITSQFYDNPIHTYTYMYSVDVYSLDTFGQEFVALK